LKRLVKWPGANCALAEINSFAREPAVADKPEYVDMISEATRQSRRRTTQVIIEPEVKETSRLAHRPERLLEWRMATFTPWKLKAWKYRDWS
jgi:hypothetical protein